MPCVRNHQRLVRSLEERYAALHGMVWCNPDTVGVESWDSIKHCSLEEVVSVLNVLRLTLEKTVVHGKSCHCWACPVAPLTRLFLKLRHGYSSAWTHSTAASSICLALLKDLGEGVGKFTFRILLSLPCCILLMEPEPTVTFFKIRFSSLAEWENPTEYWVHVNPVSLGLLPPLLMALTFDTEVSF